MSDNPFRDLPAVNELLQAPPLQSISEHYPHDLIVAAVRDELDAMRRRLSAGDDRNGQPDREAILAAIRARLEGTFQPKLRSVINATGVVLHTNLGRAPMAEEAARAAYDAARGYVNLEMNLETGKRSSRPSIVRDWICRLTGAESATAVNNNAAATVISLRAIARDKEVIISRGQLIEIGGSFRIPEIMAVSGAVLREVGTTNITRLSDYENAISERTGALMHVHSSNYRISGFTYSVPLRELVACGKQRDIPVIDDIGSGALVDFNQFGFQGEPVARDSIEAGADLVLFSGDKLLGGPQAGILAGRQDLIARIEKDPLMRAFRLDKMTLAALEATLRTYLDAVRAVDQIPILRMLATPPAELRRRAERLAERLQQVSGVAIQVVEDIAYVGGGSLPDQGMKTCVVALAPKQGTEHDLACRLRTGNPAVVGRLQDGKLLLDVRTVLPGQEDDLLLAVQQAVRETI
jgi:L-seryl-tRNA(Ser) seleniumtransferase